MTFLATLFGAKPPSSSRVDAELAKIDAELAVLPARLAGAKAMLENVADLSDEEHAAAEADLAAARRLLTRLEAQREQLAAARDRAAQDEAAVDLERRAAEAAKRVKGCGALLSEFEQRAAALAETAAKMLDVEKAADAINREIAEAERAGLKTPRKITTPYELYYSEPDVVEPARTVVEEKVMRQLPILNEGDEERWVPAGAAHKVGGRLILGPHEAVRHVERVISEKRTRGRTMSSPASELVLPKTRLGGEAIWPRAT